MFSVSGSEVFGRCFAVLRCCHAVIVFLSDRPSGIASLELHFPVDASQETRRWCELKRLGAIHGATWRQMYGR